MSESFRNINADPQKGAYRLMNQAVSQILKWVHKSKANKIESMVTGEQIHLPLKYSIFTC